MFEYEASSSRFCASLCVLQLFGVPIISLIFGLLATAPFSELMRLVTKGPEAEISIAYLIYMGLGFGLGYVVQTTVPWSRFSGGLWVWALPVCGVVWGAIESFVRDPGQLLAETFGFPLAGEGFGVIVFTLPAVASALYAAGVSAASRPPSTTFGAGVRKAVLRSPLAKLAALF